eukprot:1851923-Amphidinium_carterae.1
MITTARFQSFETKVQLPIAFRKYTWHMNALPPNTYADIQKLQSSSSFRIHYNRLIPSSKVLNEICISILWGGKKSRAFSAVGGRHVERVCLHCRARPLLNVDGSMG